jgi:hypothetical protein
MIVKDDSDWARAFFACLIASLGTPPLAYASVTAFFVPPVPGGAKERLVLFSEAISIAFVSISLIISHLPHALRRRGSDAWRFGRIGIGIVGSVRGVSMFLIMMSSWALIFDYPR